MVCTTAGFLTFQSRSPVSPLLGQRMLYVPTFTVVWANATAADNWQSSDNAQAKTLILFIELCL